MGSDDESSSNHSLTHQTPKRANCERRTGLRPRSSTMTPSTSSAACFLQWRAQGLLLIRGIVAAIRPRRHECHVPADIWPAFRGVGSAVMERVGCRKIQPGVRASKSRKARRYIPSQARKSTAHSVATKTTMVLILRMDWGPLGILSENVLQFAVKRLCGLEDIDVR